MDEETNMTVQQIIDGLQAMSDPKEIAVFEFENEDGSPADTSWGIEKVFERHNTAIFTSREF